MNFLFPRRWTTGCADLLRAFNTHGVEYLLIGSMAKALHSLNGASVDDVDVMIDSTPKNARKVGLVLRELGHNVNTDTVERLTAPGNYTQLFGSVHVLTSPKASFSFAEASARYTEVQIPRLGIPVRLAALRDLDALDALREVADKS